MSGFRVENEMRDLKNSHKSEMKQKDNQVVELRDQVARISIDRDDFKRQYSGNHGLFSDSSLEYRKFIGNRFVCWFVSNAPW